MKVKKRFYHHINVAAAPATGVTVCLLFVVFLVFQMCLSSISTAVVGVASSGDDGQAKKHEMVERRIKKREAMKVKVEEDGVPLDQAIACDRSHRSYDLCSINSPALLDPTTSTFHLMEMISPEPSTMDIEMKIRPYPRKWENFTMSRIKEFTLASSTSSLQCEAQNQVQALVFSAAGYTGNFFHDFNDGFIPLFITIRSLFLDHQDFVLVVSQARDWWVSKYADLLRAFSKHPFIILQNDTSTHCFTSVKLGLISHDFMTIDPNLMPNSETFLDFRKLLANVYGSSHGRNRSLSLRSPLKPRPRLLLVSRTGGVSRALLNQNEVKSAAEKIGFEVILFEPTPRTQLHEAYALINSSHAMLGIHGAALTHLLFLPPGAVFMQVVPLGAHWVADVCFARPARAMGLQYMVYRIKAKESSLVDKYGENDLLIKNPEAYLRNGWSDDAMTIYLKEQNVKLDLENEFGDYLKEAYRKAKQFMLKDGQFT